jgi:hypothetical protein
VGGRRETEEGDVHEGARIVADTAKLGFVNVEEVAVPGKEGCAMMGC